MASASEWCTEVSTLMNGRGVCLLPQTSRGRHLVGVGVWCSNPHQSVSLKIATHSLLLPYAHKRNRDARRGMDRGLVSGLGLGLTASVRS